MKRFKRILLYADPKAHIQPAVNCAIRIARASQGSVTVVDCLPKNLAPKGAPPVSVDQASVELDRDPRALAHRKALARLARVREQLNAQGVAASVKILIGQPTHEIAREILHNGHDIVIKTAQGDRHRKELGVFGTTTTALMRKATCPVWVVDPEQFHGLQRILVTVDPSTDDPEKMKLNVQSVNLAAELAESTGASLYVLYAWLALGESLLWRTGMSEDALRKYFNDSRLYARIEMANLLAQCDKRISSSNVYLVKGDRHEVIADFAAQRRINLIVMGTVGRTGIGGVVIGNTAEKVLQRVHCSVLTIRPGALVSRARTADGQGSQMPHSDSASKFFKPKVAVHPRPVSCEPRRRPPGRTAGQITNGRQHSTHCAFTYEHRLGSIAESHGHSSNDTLGTDRQMPK